MESSQVSKTKCSVKWKVDISADIPAVPLTIQSPAFVNSFAETISWGLEVKSGYSRPHFEYLISLKPLSRYRHFQLDLDCELQIVDANGVIWQNFQVKDTVSSTGARSMVLGVLQCGFQASRNSLIFNFSMNVRHFGPKQLVEDVRTSYDGSNGDVQFCIGHRSLFAHKYIIRLRCPVLAEKLQNSCHSETGFVISNTDYDVFYLFLRYLYSAEIVSADLKKVCGLYTLAFEYNFDELARCCIDYLVDNITLDSAIDILQWAAMKNEDQLCDFLISFVAENIDRAGKGYNFSELEFSHPDLHRQLISAVVSHVIPQKRSVLK